jgi:hypothetical protein
LASGTSGQSFYFKNLSTGSNAFFSPAHTGSAAGNRLTNLVTSGVTPVAGGGWIQYAWDGANWKLINHNQGHSIQTPFSSGNFTTDAGTWTVVSSNQVAYGYFLDGALLRLSVKVQQTSVSGGPTLLKVALPNSYTASEAFLIPTIVVDGANGAVISEVDTLSGLGLIRFFATIAGPSWQPSTTGTAVIGVITVGVN